MDIKIEIDLWDWKKGTSTNTLDVTKDIQDYRFQKTIKSPKGTCQLTVLPQSADTHILDLLNTMDVIRISEFGTMKFMGYIVRVSYTGTIDNSGKPQRNAVITVAQFGGLFEDAKMGFAMGTAFGRKDASGSEADLITYAQKMRKDIADAVMDGTSYAELVNTVASAFQSYLSSLGADNFLSYLDKYIDISTGLSSTIKPLYPRVFELFTGTEDTISFWDVVEELVQKPFNELWMDNGPRSVSIDGDDVNLTSKSCMVFRETPFDNTVGGSSSQSFLSMKSVYVDKDHFLRFDLSKSMDEVYSAYAIKSAAFQLNDVARILAGRWRVDEDRLGKYLFKPLISELFYIRMEKLDKTATDIQVGQIDNYADNAVDTLKAWFENNDKYLSGVITSMVPSDNNKDPKIGDKLTVYGLEGAFYVESIAHTWRYQGPLKTNITVTRGYNRNKPIELKDKIFKRSIMA